MERGVTSDRKGNKGIVPHIFSSDEESSDDDLIPSRGKVLHKIPKTTNVRVKKQSVKSPVKKLIEGGKAEVDPNTEKSLDLDDSLPDIIQTGRHGEELGAVCKTVKGLQYIDLSSDSDNDVDEIQGNGGDWVKGVLSSDSDDFLSDRGRRVTEKKKNVKTCQQRPSTDNWRYE
jgi:hypothetical protein